MMTQRWRRRLLLAACLFFQVAVHAADNVVISEFMARNAGTLMDEDGAFPDWIELRNAGVAMVNLDGWFLTDETNLLTKWRLPATNLAANAYLVVFASGKNRTNAGAPLHANFQLNGNGEYLALVRPDLSIATEFAPMFPEQFDDISYGDGTSVTVTKLINSGAAVKYLVPPDGSLGTNWAYLAFNDAGWSNGTSGLGFSSSSTSSLGLYSYWPIREGSGNVISNLVAGGAQGTSSGATWVNNDPQRGTVLSFNGTSSYVSAGSIPRLAQAASNFTWSFWFKQAAVNNVNAVVLGNRAGGVPSPLQFIKFTPSNFEYYRGANIGFIPYAIPNGQWLHLAVVKSNATLRYFSNGAQVGSATAGGDIEANPFYFGGDPGAPGENANGLIDDVALWGSALTTAQIQQLSAGASPLALSGFGGLTGTDVKGQMQNVSGTIYARVNFTVGDASTISGLKLRMKYDDGFIAYLNGVEVARRQAPANADWTSTATAAHADAGAVVFEDIDITGFLDALEPGANVLAVHGLNLTAADGDFLLLPELEATTLTGVGGRYFGTPTPGTANDLGFLGFVADTKFSHDRGFYETNFAVTITCVTPGATIRYTTNGTAPSATNGLVYVAPIPISRTTVLRAGAFKAGYQPSDLDAQSYLFLRDIFAQNGIGLPNNWGNDWQMDPRVVTNAAYRADITNDMKSLPVVSLALDPQQFWGPSGIYALATSQGLPYERACSAEMFFPDGSRQGFQIECGLRIAGGASRSGLTPKHGLRLLFKSIYGASKLRYRFFDNTELERFDSIAFRPNFNMSWVRTDNSGPLLNGNADGAERTHALYVRDQWTKHSHLAQGSIGAHERFVHLYIDGVYWGLYNPCERTDASFAQAYWGGDKANYDAIFSDLSSTARPVDGDKNAWNAALAYANAGLADNARYAEFARNYVDVTNLADYMMLNFYCATVDWPWQNWNALRERGTNHTFKIMVWDAEYTLDTPPWMPDDRTPNVGAGSGGVNGNDLDSPARFYFRCKQNAEWRLLFADRARKHFFNNGALTTNQTIPRFLAACDEIDRAIVCESARWGDVVRTANPYTRNAEWLTEKNRLLAQFFPQRTTNVIQHFRNAGLYPSVPAPDFNLHGAHFSGQFNLSIAAPLGTIYFTTNGTDPRLVGGAVAPGAMIFSGPFLLTASCNVRTRAFYTNTWSALTEANFIEQTPIPLRVTELMFNPDTRPGDTNDVENYEYIEVKNIGAAPLNLGGFRFTAGVTFTFPSLVLAPGGHALVVKNRALFEARYGAGKIIAGEFLGALSDDGERLRLEGAFGEEIQDFSYSDWYALSDGLGFALVIVDVSLPVDRWDERESWRPGLSPGTDEPPPSYPRVVVNEVLTHSLLPAVDQIELHNLESTNVNIGGWFLTDSPGTPKKFRVPTNTVLAANGFVVFTEAEFNSPTESYTPFSLNSSGDSVYLYAADEAGHLTGYSHGFDFGAAAEGVTFGRYITSTGEEQFPAQLASTLGGANAGPLIADVVINEIHYHPPPGSDAFLEIKNRTGHPVPLYDSIRPANTWRLNGIDFTFPTNVVLPAGGLALIVETPPADFRAKYSVPAAIPIFGPYSGTLQNSGELLELQRLDYFGPNDFAWVTLDAVRYNDRPPWPAAADGAGASLQRINASAYGNDPVNWAGAIPSRGVDLTPGGAPVITQQPASTEVPQGDTAMFGVSVTGTPPFEYQWQFNGHSITGANSSALTIANAQLSQAGVYRVLVFGSGGSTTSSNASLTVTAHAHFILQPQPITLRGSTNFADYGNTTNQNAAFTALAAGTGALRYQWRWNGTPIPRATNTSLTITNVQLADDGTYDVVVRDDIGPASSAPARLTVLLTPMIVQAPISQIVPAGGRVGASVAVLGNPPPFGYQWRSNLSSAFIFSFVSDSRTNYFNFTAHTNVAAVSWRLVVTNAAQVLPGANTAFTITTVADTDGDGMPDSYELAYGGSATGLDPAGDADGDGMSNLAEYLAGTDPGDPNSYLRIDLTAAPGLATIQFAAVSNRTYTVQYTDMLPNVGPWTKLADLLARPNNRVETIPDPGWTSNRFYRAVTPRQP